MKSIFLTVLVICLNTVAFCQNRIDLTYGQVKKMDTNIKVMRGNAILLSTNKLKPEEVSLFLNKTTIQLFQKNAKVLDSTLSSLLKRRRINIDSIKKIGAINNLDISKIIGQLSLGDTIKLFPFLGNINGKPVMPKDSFINIIIIEKAGSVIEDADGLGKRVSANEGRITALAGNVEALAKKEEADITNVKEKIINSENSLKAKVDFANLSRRGRKKMLKKIKSYSGDIANLDYFEDCPTCKSYNGDLVYDFRCKCLFQVEQLTDKNGKIYTEYHLVRDLSKIKVKAQELVRLKVVGINRYLYNVNINVEDSIYGSTPPPIFNQFFSGSSDLFNSLVTSAGTNLLQGLEADTEKRDEIDGNFAQVKTSMAAFKTAFNDLVDRQTRAYRFCMNENITCCGNELKAYSIYADLLSAVVLDIASLETRYLAEVPSSTEIISKINDQQAKLDACKKNKGTRDKALDDAKDAVKQAKEAKDKAKDDKEKAAAETALTAATEKLKKVETDGCDQAAMDAMQKLIDELNKKLPLRLTIDAMKSSLPSLTDLRRLYMFDQNIVRDHFFYRLPPIYPQGDRLNIVIDMEANDSIITKEMGFMPTYHDELNLAFSVRNKAMFSFSSGPFFAFGGELPPVSYGWKRIPASGTLIDNNAKYRLDATGNESFPMGLGGFAHMGTKVTRNFGLAATVGVGLTFNQTPLPAFMGGITISVGDRQRMNFTFGAAGVQVKELKKDLYLGNVYDTEQTLEYMKPLRFGLFASVSYSIFTSTQKRNLFSRSKK